MQEKISTEYTEAFTFIDVLGFLKRYSKFLIISIALGVAGGALVYSKYPAYKGSILMPHITDEMLIKRLQFMMPRMAGSLEDSNPMKARLMSDKFWTENFVANYVVKKQDVKDLKDLQDVKKDQGSTPELTVSLEERSLEELNRNMEYLINYVKDKSTLYYLEDLSATIKYQSTSFIANYERSVLELNIEKNIH